MGKQRVIHDFLQYLIQHRQARENSPASSSSSPKPESAQKVTNLLLLTIFAIAARFIDDEIPQDPVAGMWEAGREYCSQARLILSALFSAHIGTLFHGII